MEFRMVKEKKLGPMGVCMKGKLTMEKRKEKEPTLFLQEINTIFQPIHHHHFGDLL